VAVNNTSGFILHERASYHYWRGAGLLSIKTFRLGQAFYDIGGGKFRLDDSRWLILNHGQEYTIEVNEKVESFCIFFDPTLAQSTWHTMTHKTETLLADPFHLDSAVPQFFQKTYPNDLVVTPLMDHLRESHTVWDRAWLEERLFQLMQALFRVYDKTLSEVEQIQFVRAATRHELYDRLHLAREYIDAMYTQPILLRQIAEVAAMSPIHLLRTFKQLFNQTPHQYLIDVRLNHAKTLLTTTDTPITQICADVGFESLGSFSWLFSRRFGVSPRTYRQQF